MNGLAKLAWTTNRINKANEAFRNARQKARFQNELSDDELQRIQDYVKNQGLDIEFLIGDHYPSASGVYSSRDNINAVKKKLEKQDPLKDKDYEPIYRMSNQDSKDGLVYSGMDRTVLTHELGHAIDQKNHPKRILSRSYGETLTDFSPYGLGGAYGLLNAYSQANREEPPTVTGEVVGNIIPQTVLGGLVGASGGLIVGADENRANRNAEKLIEGVYPRAEASKHINNSRELRRLAKSTYNQNTLRGAKNAALGAGLGASAGSVLGAFIREIRPHDEQLNQQ